MDKMNISNQRQCQLLENSSVQVEFPQLNNDYVWKILFVDDEPAIVKALKGLFTFAILKFYLAGSATEGLKILEENHIDIVILVMGISIFYLRQYSTSQKVC